MIICLMQPATTFFCLPNEKHLSKTTTKKFYPAKKWETNIRKQCIENERLSDYIYSIATLWCTVSSRFIKTGQFIKLYKIM